MSTDLSDEKIQEWIDKTTLVNYLEGVGRGQVSEINAMASELQLRREKRKTASKTSANWRTCAVCGESMLKGVINYSYMVHDAIWRSAGFSYGDMAHIACLEKQLGRKLVKTDLTTCPMNQILHWVLDQGLELPRD
jgi:hypothetical protein